MQRVNSIRTIFGCAALICTVTLASGCGGRGYRTDASQMMQAYQSNNLVAAVEVAERRAGSTDEDQLSNDADHLIWRLEQGTLLRSKGDFRTSEDAYDYADWAIDWFDEQPEVSLSGEAGATLTNLATLPYRGYAYDRIMLSTYRALNLLTLGEKDIARVELNRAHVRQQEAIERNRQRIEAAEEEALEAREDGIVDDASHTTEMDSLGDLDIPYAEVYRAQGDYVNPFTEFLHGLYFLFAGRSADDLESGRHAFMRVAAMIGQDNPFIAQDLEMAERIVAGGQRPTLTYVIFETGRAPSREEKRINVPMPIRGVNHVPAAFPKLVFHNDHERYLAVDFGEGSMNTAHLADMDTIVGLEFQNELPAVTARTIQIAATQAAAQAGIDQGVRSDWRARAAASLFGGAYRQAQAQADLRTWRTLPKQFQYARFATPEDRSITVRTPSGHIMPVEIEPGQVNVVYVKSAVRGAPLNIWQFQLR